MPQRRYDSRMCRVMMNSIITSRQGHGCHLQSLDFSSNEKMEMVTFCERK
jgi:hypothetical protein